MVEREIRDRVKELRRVKASELVPNPKNWRRHPKEQSAALQGLLRRSATPMRSCPGMPDGRLILIDGHCAPRPPRSHGAGPRAQRHRGRGR